MQILRLYLTDAGLASGACWALLDARGQLIASGGRHDPWPAASETELVLAAGKTRFVTQVLPAAVPVGAHEVLGYVLEPGLANFPADNLYQAGKAGPDGWHWIAVTAREPLEQAQVLLHAMGRRLCRVLPEEMLLPRPAADCWTLAQLEAGWLVRQSLHQAVFLAKSAEMLACSLGDIPPNGLMVCRGSGVPAHWGAVPQQQCAAHDWRCSEAASPVNFATGLLRSRQCLPSWRVSLRRSMQLLLCVVLLDTGLTLLQSGWVLWQKKRMEQGMVVAAAELGLKVRNGEQALQQTAALLESERRQLGLPMRAGALELMAALGEVMGVDRAPQTLLFSENRLYFTVNDPGAALSRQWHQALQARRLALQAEGNDRWVLRARDYTE
jgi:hypothetical protein